MKRHALLKLNVDELEILAEWADQQNAGRFFLPPEKRLKDRIDRTLNKVVSK